MKFIQAKLAYRTRNYPEAERMFTDLIGSAKDASQTQVANTLTHNSLLYLAFSSIMTGHKAQARIYLQQSVAADTKTFGADHYVTREAKRSLAEMNRTGTLAEAQVSKRGN